jgi:hypothetical protein
MKRLRFGLFFFALQIVFALSHQPELFAYGEIFALRTPEEIPEGDDVGIAVTATLKEKGIDRSVVIEVPSNWKLKRSYAVIAGGDEVFPLPLSSSIAHLFTSTKAHSVIAFGDTIRTYDGEAAGVAYFFVFSMEASSIQTAQTAIVKAALVERNDPEAPKAIDKKTKKPIEVNTDWKLAFPFHQGFSFADISGKRSAATIRLLKNWRIGRALLLEGSKRADAVLNTQTDAIQRLFAHGFSVEFWFKTLEPNEPILSFDHQGKTVVAIGTNVVTKPPSEPIAQSRSIFADGIWHHLALSRDSTQMMRLYIDAQPFAATTLSTDGFANIDGLTLGSSTRSISLSIDELHLIKRAFTKTQDFQNLIVSATRDTMKSAFALFHFNDFGKTARSSIGIRSQTAVGEDAAILPIIFALDSNAKIVEASSPVQADQVVLTADMTSPTKVNVGWRTTSELGIKEYHLEQRVGNYGKFEKVLTVQAKQGSKLPKKGGSIIYRNAYLATEPLPAIRGDIELFYRVAIIGFGDPIRYSEPVKIEYGAERDVFVEQNQPNPFNPTTTIAFRLTRAGYITLGIYDIIGRQVATLVSGRVAAGRHTYELDATNWPGGIYFYKVKTEQSTVTRKMVLAK